MNQPLLNIWRNTSSHSQSGKVTSESYEYRTKSLRITIHRHIDYPPDQWLTSCYEVGVRALELNSKTIEEAQREARKTIAERLLKLHAEVTAPAKDGSDSA